MGAVRSIPQMAKIQYDPFSGKYWCPKPNTKLTGVRTIHDADVWGKGLKNAQVGNTSFCCHALRLETKITSAQTHGKTLSDIT